MRIRDIVGNLNEEFVSRHRQLQGSTISVIDKFYEEKCGEIIGQGHFRQVFEYRNNPDYVIKANINSTDTHGFDQNKNEWNNWQTIDSKFPQYRKWFAPCVEISPNGHYLVQLRVDPITQDNSRNMPHAIPAFLDAMDNKRKNWGMLNNHPVLFDYNYVNYEDDFEREVRRFDFMVDAVWDNKEGFVIQQDDVKNQMNEISQEFFNHMAGLIKNNGSVQQFMHEWRMKPGLAWRSRDDNGNNMFHLTVIHDRIDIFQFLLKQESGYMGHINNNDMDPIELAVSLNREDILDILKYDTTWGLDWQWQIDKARKRLEENK